MLFFEISKWRCQLGSAPGITAEICATNITGVIWDNNRKENNISHFPLGLSERYLRSTKKLLGGGGLEGPLRFANNMYVRERLRCTQW